jgi:hemerythrin superfamily protein
MATKESSKSESKAVQLLKADHRKVEKLFASFEDADADEKQTIATEIMTELKVHMEVEEQLFYPFVRTILEDTMLVTEAEIEHNSAKELMTQIQDATDADEEFEASVKVLKEQIEHHVKEEENELFPKLKSHKDELDGLGEEMEALKENLSSMTASEDELRLQGLPSALPVDEKKKKQPAGNRAR